MVERYVFVKLKNEHATDEGRKEVIERTLADLKGIAGLKKIIVGAPADDSAKEAWDVSIVVVFDSIDAVGPYLSDPAHRTYVDDFLMPRTEVIKYWNFDVDVAEGPAA